MERKTIRRGVLGHTKLLHGGPVPRDGLAQRRLRAGGWVEGGHVQAARQKNGRPARADDAGAKHGDPMYV